MMETATDESSSSFAGFSSSSETYMVGFIIANIVGTQYYSGRISGREMVALLREPSNPYDKNAIQVFNTRTVQVGHIERSVAAVLSPLLDCRLIAAEGIVPKSSSTKSRFKVPCQIHIFATLDSFPIVKSAIASGGLMLISDSDSSFTLSEAAVVKERKAESDFKSVDQIFNSVDKNLKRKAKLESVEPPSEVIKSDLFLHQKEALWWLLHRENSDELPPFWEERDGIFVNVLTDYSSDTRPEPLRGGIFADDMGLGKTLTLLSLIAFDSLGGSGSPLDVEPSETQRKGKRARLSKKDNGPRKKPKADKITIKNIVDESTTALVKKTTLIVCPPSVFSTWVTQLEEHTRPGKLKVYMYYGDRTHDVEELKKYDIVLTTYSTLGAEAHSSAYPAQKMEWWRIILDEAHLIKNTNSKQSRAVHDLKATCRWVVTGTPIQNGLLDLFSLMAFLRFQPFSVSSYWQRLVQRPVSHGDKKGLKRLQVVMAIISLRRTKDKNLIGLPPKTVETCYVELSPEERKLYDHMEQEAKGIVNSLIDNGNLLHKYSTVLSIILRLRQICTDMALCPPDFRSLFSFEDIKDVSDSPELLEKLVAVVQDGEDFDCPICISPPSDIVITRCAHIYCRACILKTIERTKPCCPLCRAPLSQSDLFTAPPESSDADNNELSSLSRSSKTSTLLTLLQASRCENPNTKSVVFSQFRKMLLLLQEPLRSAGYKILLLDGSMSAKKRADVIAEFGNLNTNGPVVLLASLRASGTGINLTAASRVYLMEPWWNPAVEEQAMDRVHRIGQKEEVKIVRLITRNSIEERILELQEKKKKLAMEAFRRRGQKDKREVSIDDVRLLMSL